MPFTIDIDDFDTHEIDILREQLTELSNSGHHRDPQDVIDSALAGTIRIVADPRPNQRPNQRSNRWLAIPAVAAIAAAAVAVVVMYDNNDIVTTDPSGPAAPAPSTDQLAGLADPTDDLHTVRPEGFGGHEIGRSETVASGDNCTEIVDDASIVVFEPSSGADATVSYVFTRNDLYRTPEGIGVGTPLSTLHAIYGDRLVVDRLDGFSANMPGNTGTDGLTGLFTDVAGVRFGEMALTFTLSAEDTVDGVKASRATNWGDLDEGVVEPNRSFYTCQ